MKKFLKHRSKRHGYDGWALRIKGDPKPMAVTVCTTRKEARELLEEQRERHNRKLAGESWEIQTIGGYACKVSVMCL